MKVIAINMPGQPKGQILNLPDDFAEYLIKEEQVEEYVTESKPNRGKKHVSVTAGGEGLVEGDS